MEWLFLDFEDINLEKIGNGTKNPYFKSVIEFIEEVQLHNTFSTQTSGSTGEPKTIDINKNAAIASAKLSNEFFQIDKNSTFLLALNIKYIGGKMLLLRAMTARAKVVLIEPSIEVCNPTENLISFVSLTSIQVDAILSNNLEFFNQCEKCLIGGGQVSTALLEKIKKANTTCSFYESFGMTETISHFAIRDLAISLSRFDLLSGFEVDINDDGELVVYHSDITHEPIQTHDIVRIYPDQSFDWIGRSDFTINTSGVKVQPEEIEKLLSRAIDSPFVISSIPDDRLGERVVLVVYNPSESSEYYQKIIKDCIEEKAQRPKDIISIDRWYSTETNKPKRRLIQDYIKKIPL